MTRRVWFVCLFVLLLQPFPSRAQSHTFGLGLILGSPKAGISGKYWLSGVHALDFGLGWGNRYGRWLGRNYDGRCADAGFRAQTWPYCADRHYYRYGDWGRYLHFHADYLFHNFNLIRARERFPLYFGPGMVIRHLYDDPYEDPTLFGVRFSLGLAFMPRRAPLDVFFELAPTLNLAPDSYFYMNAGLGARYWF